MKKTSTKTTPQQVSTMAEKMKLMAAIAGPSTVPYFELLTDCMVFGQKMRSTKARLIAANDNPNIAEELDRHIDELDAISEGLWEDIGIIVDKGWWKEG